VPGPCCADGEHTLSRPCEAPIRSAWRAFAAAWTRYAASLAPDELEDEIEGHARALRQLAALQAGDSIETTDRIDRHAEPSP
jgi:hypothetical protein